MAPNAHDSGIDLAQFGDDLKRLAQRLVDRSLWDKVDLSGAVQQTFLEAWKSWNVFQGLSEAAKPAWLRTALAHNLNDKISELRAQMRDIQRECSLNEAMDASSTNLAVCLASDESSPSQKAIRNEDAERLKAAIAQLSEDRRKAVELHYQGHKLAEIAQVMGKTEAAVAQLVSRGIKDLHSMVDHQ
jgi:RNA polymerase sigma-70 factor (ECF subfamily)